MESEGCKEPLAGKAKWQGAAGTCLPELCQPSPGPAHETQSRVLGQARPAEASVAVDPVVEPAHLSASDVLEHSQVESVARALRQGHPGRG